MTRIILGAALIIAASVLVADLPTWRALLAVLLAAFGGLVWANKEDRP